MAVGAVTAVNIIVGAQQTQSADRNGFLTDAQME
jgi:hypothetical protein